MVLGALTRRAEADVGGPARARVVVTLATVLALDAADKGAVGAMALEVQRDLSINNTQLGLMLTVSGIVGAIATLPFGALVDRIVRTRLLRVTVVLWSAAMVGGALAPSFGWLLVSRAALGILAASAYPAVMSLLGDWFPRAERGRIVGLVLAGELVGTGVGVAAAGSVAAAISWRASLAALGLLALIVTWLVRRIPEPARGGASQMAPGTEHIASVTSPSSDPVRSPSQPGSEASASPTRGSGAAEPHEASAPATKQPPRDMSLWAAISYVLRIRTNLILVFASALGYYLFAGIRAFGIEYAGQHYDVGQAVASVLVLVIGAGGLVGVVAGGRLSDWLITRGRAAARVTVPALGLGAATLLFAPGVVIGSIAAALPLLVVAAMFVGGSFSPLDAARLDVVPADLWGRAEAARTVVRQVPEGAAPLAFGALADFFATGTTSSGLEPAFLIMSISLLIGSIVLFSARRSYVTDSATAHADPSRS